MIMLVTTLAAPVTAVSVLAAEPEDAIAARGRILLLLARERAPKSIEMKTEQVAGGFRLNIWFPGKWGMGGADDPDLRVGYDTRQIAGHVLRSYPWHEVIVFRAYLKGRNGDLSLEDLVTQYSFDPAREILTLDYQETWDSRSDEAFRRAMQMHASTPVPGRASATTGNRSKKLRPRKRETPRP